MIKTLNELHEEGGNFTVNSLIRDWGLVNWGFGIWDLGFGICDSLIRDWGLVNWGIGNWDLDLKTENRKRKTEKFPQIFPEIK